MGFEQGPAIKFCEVTECTETFPLREYLDDGRRYCLNHQPDG